MPESQQLPGVYWVQKGDPEAPTLLERTRLPIGHPALLACHVGHVAAGALPMVVLFTPPGADIIKTANQLYDELNGPWVAGGLGGYA
ncbi:MAG TPA: hypothetical protein VLF43_00225 [Candidatus Saccharimonadales bacterium]|nr:hypothetical protein [Candidatus Saccharimonadales bacterium]